MKLYHNFDTRYDDFDDFLFVVDKFSYHKKRKSGDDCEHNEIDRKLHVQKLLHEKMFHKEYKMSQATFTYLCIILGPAVERNQDKSPVDDPITVEITIACNLCLLAGETQPYQKHMFEHSKTGVQSIFCCFLDAANNRTELDIKLLENK